GRSFGSLCRLPKLLPEGVVKELAFLGNTLNADRALAMGFVSEVHPDSHSLLAAAVETAKRIAAKAPLAISGSKSAIHYARDHSVSDALEWAVQRQAAIWNLPEIMEAMRARMAKDTGKFADLEPLPTLTGESE
ncbi:MAG: enoyl-CoA hydratase-related protein, partial [Myxococcota bacterium]